LEQAKNAAEIEAIEMKLNILDIGRSERGMGHRTEGWFVKMADSMRDSKWMPEVIKTWVCNPTVAAVATALGTRGLVA
jgi:hypothetical protein